MFYIYTGPLPSLIQVVAWKTTNIRSKVLIDAANSDLI